MEYVVAAALVPGFLLLHWFMRRKADAGWRRLAIDYPTSRERDSHPRASDGILSSLGMAVVPPFEYRIVEGSLVVYRQPYLGLLPFSRRDQMSLPLAHCVFTVGSPHYFAILTVISDGEKVCLGVAPSTSAAQCVIKALIEAPGHQS